MKHPNQRAHNWLAYKVVHTSLINMSSMICGTVYDFGAGSSPYKDFILDGAEMYVAVEWSASCHDISPDIVADLNQTLPIESNKANTIISLQVLEHLREPMCMLLEANRILQSGGYIILHIPWQWRVHEQPHDYYRYTPYALYNMFNNAGFVDVEVIPLAGFFTTIVLKINYFALRFVRGPRFLKLILEVIITPFWYIGQMLAPYLDKLDKDWELEAPWYSVTARKP